MYSINLYHALSVLSCISLVSTMVHPQGQAPRHRLLSQREVLTRAGQSATSLAVAGQSWDVGTGDDLSDLGMSDIFWLS